MEWPVARQLSVDLLGGHEIRCTRRMVEDALQISITCLNRPVLSHQGVHLDHFHGSGRANGFLRRRT